MEYGGYFMEADKNTDLMEDIFLFIGMLTTSSSIFFMRVLSIVTEINLPLSGNIGMKYTKIELWRIVLFIITWLSNISLIVIMKKKDAKHFKQYCKTECIGVLIIVGFEYFFYVLASILSV